MSGGPANGSPYSSTIGPTGNFGKCPAQQYNGQGPQQRHLPDGAAQIEDRVWEAAPRRHSARRGPGVRLERRQQLCPWRRRACRFPDSLLPRIRYAYGTLGGLLAGQASSNFSATRMQTPKRIDFGGDASTPGVVRLPQIRYTMPGAWWGASFSVSAEVAEPGSPRQSGLIANDAGVSSAAVSPGTNACTTTAAGATCTVGALSSPSTRRRRRRLTFTPPAWYLPQPWGHVDVSGGPSARPRFHRRPFHRQAVYRLRRPLGRGRGAGASSWVG